MPRRHNHRSKDERHERQSRRRSDQSKDGLRPRLQGSCDQRGCQLKTLRVAPTAVAPPHTHLQRWRGALSRSIWAPRWDRLIAAAPSCACTCVRAREGARVKERPPECSRIPAGPRPPSSLPLPHYSSSSSLSRLAFLPPVTPRHRGDLAVCRGHVTRDQTSKAPLPVSRRGNADVRQEVNLKDMMERSSVGLLDQGCVGFVFTCPPNRSPPPMLELHPLLRPSICSAPPVRPVEASCQSSLLLTPAVISCQISTFPPRGAGGKWGGGQPGMEVRGETRRGGGSPSITQACFMMMKRRRFPANDNKTPS